MIKKCIKCEKNLGNVHHKILYCTNCKIIAIKENKARFAPKGRIKSKEWRDKNPEWNKKIKRECYKKRRNYYLNKAKKYRQNHKEERKKYDIEVKNRLPYRAILLKSKIPILCKLCGVKENYKGY